MPTFTTAFTQPAAVAGLTATPDLDASAVDLAWTATTLGALFWRYNVYRLDPETGVFVMIGSVATESTPTYRDKEARHGTSSYAVTVSNGWAESDPTLASTTLPLDWWIVDPVDPALVFPVPHVQSYDELYDPQAETFVPLDADAPVVVSGALLPPAGTITTLLLPAEQSTFGLLKRATQSTYVALKTPFGDVYRVKVGTLRRSRGSLGGGSREVRFDYVAVD